MNGYVYNKVTAILLLPLLLNGYIGVSQVNCLVHKPEISESYQGECKNGMAHGKGSALGKDSYEGRFVKGLPEGKGTYIWSTREVYIGDWVKGMREGEGIYKYKKNNRDTLQIGLWEKDKYLGPKPPKPKVLTRVGVDRYVFKRMSNMKNRILIDFFQNGSRNYVLENFMICSSSGYETSIGETVGYEGIEFPVVIKLNYVTWNNFRTIKNYIIFEFEISEPGDWKVEVHN